MCEISDGLVVSDNLIICFVFCAADRREKFDVFGTLYFFVSANYATKINSVLSSTRLSSEVKQSSSMGNYIPTL
jgi:hypothetical protein